MESERIEFQVVDEVTLRGHPFRAGNVRSLGIVVTQYPSMLKNHRTENAMPSFKEPLWPYMPTAGASTIGGH